MTYRCEVHIQILLVPNFTIYYTTLYVYYKQEFRRCLDCHRKYVNNPC